MGKAIFLSARQLTVPGHILTILSTETHVVMALCVILSFTGYCLYSLWFWIRQLERLPGFIAPTSQQYGERTGTPNDVLNRKTRPRDLLIVPTAVYFFTAIFLLTMPHWARIGFFHRLGYILLTHVGIVLFVLVVLWTVHASSPQPETTDNYALVLGFFLQFSTFLTLPLFRSVGSFSVLWSPIIPAILLSLVLVFYMPEFRDGFDFRAWISNSRTPASEPATTPVAPRRLPDAMIYITGPFATVLSNRINSSPLTREHARRGTTLFYASVISAVVLYLATVVVTRIVLQTDIMFELWIGGTVALLFGILWFGFTAIMTSLYCYHIFHAYYGNSKSDPIIRRVTALYDSRPVLST